MNDETTPPHLPFASNIAPSPLTGIILDPWTRLRRHTTARIALGRAGGSLPTAELLEFAKAHAAARDAVRSELDFDALEQAVRPAGLPIVRLKTAVPNHHAYLLRPDLGRCLDEASRQSLEASPMASPIDATIIIADGLSALAAQVQAPGVLATLVPMLTASGLTLGPLTLVHFGRVAVQDQIGSILGAKLALILLGERPGLGAPDSLGAYLVYLPRPGRTDADRNCVSNIRSAGLSPANAARTLHYLMVESLRKQISGVTLKDDRIAPRSRSIAEPEPSMEL